MLINTNKQRPPFMSITDKVIEQVVEWDTMDIVRGTHKEWKVKPWATLELGLQREIAKSRYAMGGIIFGNQLR